MLTIKFINMSVSNYIKIKIHLPYFDGYASVNIDYSKPYSLFILVYDEHKTVNVERRSSRIGVDELLNLVMDVIDKEFKLSCDEKS